MTDSDIVKSALLEVVTGLAESTAHTLINGTNTYPITVIASAPVELMQQNETTNVWQKSKRFTFIIPDAVNRHSIGRGWQIQHENIKWDITEISNGYGQVLEVLAIADIPKSFKNGFDRKGR